MSVELHDCPECSIEQGGLPREQAWDIFWMTTGDRRAQQVPALVQHAATRYLTVGRQDPTWTAVLSCGHAVPA